MSEKTDKPKVAVLGMGITGSAMAKNLLKAGFKVAIYNRTPAKAAALAESGATPCSTPAEAAQQADFIILMLTDPQAVWDVVGGAQGVFSAGSKEKTLVQMSNLDVETTLALGHEAAACGMKFLDCPVTGSKKQVEAAEVIVEAGGDPAVLDSARPVLSAISKHIVYAGEIGAGTSLKLCMNLIVAQMTTGLCESAALAERLKIDPALIFEVIEESPALNCVYFKIKKEPILAGSYPPAFSLANMLKDVRFMNKEAAAHDLELPVTKAVQQLMERAEKQGLKEQDLSVCRKVL